jgi:hypothetical protein
MARLSKVAAWKHRVDAIMKRDYCIDTDDAGLGEEEVERFFADGQTPEDFVRWFAEKYDLDRSDSYFPVPRPGP